MAARLKGMGQARYQRDGDPHTSGPGFAVTLQEDLVDRPRSWRKPRTIFVNSMSDLFHPEVPLGFIQRVFETMEDTPHHTYQILTKRSKRVSEIASELVWPSNVWMGVSVENATYRFRIDHLRSAPAAVRFLSVEPLVADVGEVDLSEIHWVIVGGESGTGARPMEAEWVRDIRDQCVEANVAFFFKQWGGLRPKTHGRELDGRLWDEYPRNSSQLSLI